MFQSVVLIRGRNSYFPRCNTWNHCFHRAMRMRRSVWFSLLLHHYLAQSPLLVWGLSKLQLMTYSDDQRIPFKRPFRPSLPPWPSVLNWNWAKGRSPTHYQWGIINSTPSHSMDPEYEWEELACLIPSMGESVFSNSFWSSVIGCWFDLSRVDGKLSGCGGNPENIEFSRLDDLYTSLADPQLNR